MGDATPRPDFIRHYSEIQKPDNSHYPGDDELFASEAFLSRLPSSVPLRRLSLSDLFS